MANEPDFGEQLCWLEEVITAAGHKTIFLPKFHPELNAIERYWGCLKKFTRWRCDDSLYSLRENVDSFLKGEFDQTKSNSSLKNNNSLFKGTLTKVFGFK